MKRASQGVTWLLFAATAYLIVAGTLSPWIHLPNLRNIGFTLVFVLFSLAHCATVEGPRRTTVFFLTSSIVSYLMEEFGVRTGRIYGPYHYGDLLGPKLGHVPMLIPLAWFMMIYPSWAVAKALLSGVRTDSPGGVTAMASVAAMVMTAWDTVMDPGMAAGGAWIWEKGGKYFGVPLQNYAGWLATTFLVYWITGMLWRGTKRGGAPSTKFEALPAIVYALFALRYVTRNSFPELQVVALFCMGLPVVVALLRMCMKKTSFNAG